MTGFKNKKFLNVLFTVDPLQIPRAKTSAKHMLSDWPLVLTEAIWTQNTCCLGCMVASDYTHSRMILLRSTCHVGGAEEGRLELLCLQQISERASAFQSP